MTTSRRVKFEARVPTLETHQPLDIPYSLGIWYPAPTPLTLGDQHRFDTPIHEYEQIINNPYTQREDFRAWHNEISHLTLQCCQGISTRFVSASLDLALHLQYIFKYGAACEPCQDAEDYRVSIYTLPEGEEVHHPHYHPLFYSYPSRGKRSQPVRIQSAIFFNNPRSWDWNWKAINCIEKQQAPYFFEYQPSSSEIITTLICVDQTLAPVDNT